MSRDEVIDAHRHHRQVGHARVLRVAVRRPGEGRAADRPVRRRLLFVVHRRRPRDARHAARRAAGGRGRALGIGRRGRLHDRARRPARSAAPRSRCTCAKARTSCCRAGAWRRSSASTPTTSRCRSLMRKEVWDEEKKAFTRHRRGRDRQPGVGAVGAAEAGDHRRSSTTSSTSTSRTTRAAARPRARAGRGPHRVHAAAVRSVGRAVRPVGPRASARRASSTCGACSSWTTPSSCCRRTCASCAASSTRTTCRSTCRARSCRSRATSRRSAAAASSACSTCSTTSRSRTRRSTRRSGRAFGNVLKEGFVDDARQPRASSRKLARFASTASGSDDAGRGARRLRRAHEGGPAGDLLRDRRHVTRPRATARTSRSSARRASRCCCCRTASTNGWRRR